MNTHRFGGQLTALDRPIGARLSIRVWGELACDGDEAAAARLVPAILEIVGRIAEDSPSAAKLCADPVAFPTKIEPAIAQAFAQRGLPAVRIGQFNLSLSPESIATLEAAKMAAVTPPALAVGAQVLVQWSDGNRYPGEVRALGDGQVQVAFGGGQVQWIAAAYVARA